MGRLKGFIREEVERQLAEAKKQSEPTSMDREYWLKKLEKGMTKLKSNDPCKGAAHVEVTITGDKLVAASVISLLLREQRRFHKETGREFSAEFEHREE